MIEELRISSLGVIDSSTLELGPGFTVVTGETGAGKTMVVTALGLLLGGRADSGAVRVGARQARVEGVVRTDRIAGLAEAVEEVGGQVEDQVVVLARNVSAEGRSRAYVGGAGVPVATLAELAEPLVAVHGQSDQHRLLKASTQRAALDVFAGATVADSLDRYGQLFERLVATERELVEVVATARERAREADLLRFGVEEIEAVAPQSGEDHLLAAEEARLGHADTLRTAAEHAREALSSEQDSPDALGAVAAARGQLESVREHDPEAGALADRVAEVTYLLSDLAADVASYASGIDSDPVRLAGVSERRAALLSLTRKYGDSVDAVLGWSEQARNRLLELDATDETIDRLSGARVALRAELAEVAAVLSTARRMAAERLSAAVTAELSLLAMVDASIQVQVGDRELPTPARRRQPAAGCAPRRRPLAPLPRPRRRRGRVPPCCQQRLRAAPAAQGRVGRRAVPRDAGRRGLPGRHPPGADVRLRRGRRRRRRCGGRRDRATSRSAR